MSAAEQIVRLQEKLQQLLRQQQKLRKENEDLRIQLQQADTARVSLNTRVQELQQVVALMKLAAGNLNDKEKKDFEKEINRFVREIDKCIAFLSG